MKRKKAATNTSKVKGKSVQGTGKGPPPMTTHKTGGAIRNSAKAKGPLDSRWRDGQAGSARKTAPARTHSRKTRAHSASAY